MPIHESVLVSKPLTGATQSLVLPGTPSCRVVDRRAKPEAQGKDGWARILGGLGNAYIATGPSSTAHGYLTRALKIARAMDDDALLPTLLNNLGNLLSSMERYDAAAEFRIMY